MKLYDTVAEGVEVAVYADNFPVTVPLDDRDVQPPGAEAVRFREKDTPPSTPDLSWDEMPVRVAPHWHVRMTYSPYTAKPEAGHPPAGHDPSR